MGIKRSMGYEDIEVQDRIHNVVFELSFWREWIEETESNYGANADGRMGESRTYIEDDTALGIQVKLKTGYFPIYKLCPSHRNRIKSALNLWLLENDPDE